MSCRDATDVISWLQNKGFLSHYASSSRVSDNIGLLDPACRARNLLAVELAELRVELTAARRLAWVTGEQLAESRAAIEAMILRQEEEDWR